MAKLFPSKQVTVDLRNDTTVVVSNVKILTSTSDHLDLPNAVDTVMLQSTRGAANPTFYLNLGGNQVAFDGATVGTAYTVVSLHKGKLNYARGSASSSNPG